MKIVKTKILLTTLGVALIAGMAASLRADDTTASAASAAQPAKTKFSGSVTAVDAKAMTFTVDDQVFTITSESRINRNGKTATLADVVVGDPVKGSYTKDADGKLDVNRARFGKGKRKKSQDSDTSATNAAPSSAQSQ